MSRCQSTENHSRRLTAMVGPTPSTVDSTSGAALAFLPDVASPSPPSEETASGEPSVPVASAAPADAASPSVASPAAAAPSVAASVVAAPDFAAPDVAVGPAEPEAL